MSLVINTNVSAVNTQRHLETSRNMMEQAMERLSSGKRINSAMALSPRRDKIRTSAGSLC